MLHNPETLNANILAGDIKRYLEQGIELKDIKAGAIENGIPVSMWDEALKLFEIIQSEQQHKIKQEKNRFKKIMLFFGIVIVIGIFFTFLVFQNIDSLRSIQASKKTPTPAPVITETITIETEPVIATPVQTIQDERFNKQIENNSLKINYRITTPDQKIFSSVLNSLSFISTYIDKPNIKSVKIAFDNQSNPVLNHFEFQDETGLPYFLASNTITPFQFQNQTILYQQTNRNNNQAIINYNEVDWQSLLEKINFDKQSKKNLSFSAEIFLQNEKPHFKASYNYPNHEEDAIIEVDFMTFIKGNGQRNIAFGRNPVISTGFLAEKYPIKRGPKPKDSE